jgi:hypothetical protein
MEAMARGGNGPALSVVLATPGDFASLLPTMHHLRAQTARDRLEIVLVTPSADRLRLDVASLAPFAMYQVVATGVMRSKASANAAGIRAARAEVVALAEDHCFPEPAWAAALIRRHAEPWAAVGPVIVNANPATTISWSDLVINYGPWLESAAGGAVTSLPGHNTSYKRAALLPYGDRLADWLEAEAVLHDDLARRGERLYLEPAARVAHVNFSRPAAWRAALFHGGRVYAAARAEQWPVARRLLYGTASPLIPLVRLHRLLRARPRMVGPAAWRFAPVLAAGLAVDAAGQAAGYLLGSGDAIGRLARFEFDRAAHVTDEDRRVAFPAV